MRLYMTERRKDPVFAAQGRERVKRWQHANPERSRAASAAWRKKNPDRAKELNARWRSRRTPEEISAYGREAYRNHRRAHHINKKFGLTEAQYELMIVAQDGHCAICAELDRPEKRLAVDHDHVTGRIRALLCDRCNRGIGFLDENPERLCAAANYIERHKLTSDPILG